LLSSSHNTPQEFTVKQSLIVALAIMSAQAAFAADEPQIVQIAPNVLSTKEELAKCAAQKGTPCVVFSQEELKKLAKSLYDKGFKAGVEGTFEALEKQIEKENQRSGS
jgi:tRNA(Ile2) C34 agmatinyltransferase TiaS